MYKVANHLYLANIFRFYDEHLHKTLEDIRHKNQQITGSVHFLYKGTLYNSNDQYASKVVTILDKSLHSTMDEYIELNNYRNSLFNTVYQYLNMLTIQSSKKRYHHYLPESLVKPFGLVGNNKLDINSVDTAVVEAITECALMGMLNA